jgi:hypothetical protein
MVTNTRLYGNESTHNNRIIVGESARSNRGTVGNGVFFVVRGEVI